MSSRRCSPPRRPPSNNAAAIAALQQFKTAAGSEAALTSAADALIAQVNGTPVDTSGTGVTVGAADPGAQALRVFNNPIPFRANPNATYKVLISGRAGGFRHQSIVDYEWMIQQLGDANGFDVEIWDPNIGASPGRQAPAGVSLATSPFLDLATLKQYKTIVMNSTVGINGTATLNAVEFANLQAYIRGGGGIIPVHGGTDSMQNVPWYMDLIGGGFTSHGGNQGGILIDTESGGHVEFINADPAHTEHRLDARPLVLGGGALQHQPRPGGPRHRAPAGVRERGLARRPDRLLHGRAAQHGPARHGLVPQLRGRALLHVHPRAQLAVRDRGLVPRHDAQRDPVDERAGVRELRDVQRGLRAARGRGVRRQRHRRGQHGDERLAGRRGRRLPGG